NTRNGGLPHRFGVAAKIARHTALQSKSNVAHGKAVPRTPSGFWGFVNDVGFAQPAQRTVRSAVARVGLDLSFFCLRQLFQFRVNGAEAQLAVKPERARVDGLLVAVADLVGIDGDGVRSMKLAEQPQVLRIDPGRLAVTIGGEGVEADLSPVKQ